MIGPPLPKQHAISRFIYDLACPHQLGKKLTPLQEMIYRLKVKERKTIIETAIEIGVNPSSVYNHITCIRAKGYWI